MLTQAEVLRAAPKERQYKLSDGNGLALLVMPNGSKLWRFRYHFHNVEKMLSLGSYPEVSLVDAREKRDDARKVLRSGNDPAVARATEKESEAVAAVNTFEVMANEYLALLEEQNSAEATMDKNKWLLLDLASPLHRTPITKVTSADILQVLRAVEKSGRRETARRLRGVIGSVFRYSIVNLKAETDPTYALRGSLRKYKHKSRPAIIDEEELGGLLVCIDEYDGWPTLRAALLFASLTMVRPVEVRLMRRSEVNWPKATWKIPGERMKMRRDFEVPLSKQALNVLRSVWDLSDGDGYVFHSIRSRERPLSENALNSALRRMGYTKDEMTAHGFKSSASTILNERQFNHDVIELCLAHEEEDDERRIYNRARHKKARTELMQIWADLLDDFRQLKRKAV
ncbi:tyrosine-type recombinase/integrase [Rhodoplanes sp. Z2-YC6860]|uniref:tyrosine-type recombinase/integrase n=1 Tax=Rhodoplanes sp. Z2-YC6860 TaxID=674703 RepID=UPI00078DFD82|nr:integrase arm-type DNA-binding domain-containing protein [Rhodoplanes sp. Z2-YC6860]AMN44736.1 symbiosis island integrase [Rhodoplanes sp. Z2-YC6860]